MRTAEVGGRSREEDTLWDECVRACVRAKPSSARLARFQCAFLFWLPSQVPAVLLAD